jgi:hypothetical protein
MHRRGRYCPHLTPPSVPPSPGAAFRVLCRQPSSWAIQPISDLYHFFGQCGLRNYEAPLNCKTSRPKGLQVTNNLATKYSDE